MKWWLVWLQAKDDLFGMDATDPEGAACVYAPTPSQAEQFARVMAAALDKWVNMEPVPSENPDRELGPDDYNLLRIVEATVRETGEQ